MTVKSINGSMHWNQQMKVRQGFFQSFYFLELSLYAQAEHFAE